MYAYYTYKDILLGHGGSFDAMHPCILKRIYAYTGKIEINELYDETIAIDFYMDEVIRPIRDSILRITDKLELPSYRNITDIKMSVSEKDSVCIYRNALRDLPTALKNSEYVTFDFPEIPACVPKNVQGEIQGAQDSYIKQVRHEFFKVVHNKMMRSIT